MSAGVRKRRRGVLGWLSRRSTERDKFDRAGAAARRERRRRELEARAASREKSIDASGTTRRLPLIQRGTSKRARVEAAGTATKHARATVRDAPVRKARRRPTEAELRAREARRARNARRMRIVLAVLTVVGTLAAWYQVPRLALFEVREVAVSGASATSDLQVRTRVDDLLARETIYTVDTEAVERSVRGLPFVHRATVTHHFPDTISIDITEYKPLAFGISGADGWLVARDGRVLTNAELGDWSGRVPVVRLRARNLNAGERVGDEPALRLLRAMSPTFPGTFKAVEVRWNDLDRDKRVDYGEESFIATMDSGAEVRFGLPQELPQKLLVVERLLGIYGPGARGSIEYVDVSVPARPAVRTKAASGASL